MTLSLIKDGEFIDFEKHIQPMLFKIQPFNSYPFSSKEFQNHLRNIRNCLSFLLPENLSFSHPEQFLEWSKINIPLIKWSECERLPDCFSIYLFCQPIKGLKTENFFIDLIKRCLIPAKEPSILSFQQMPFYLQGIEQELFFLAEATILVENGNELDTIKKNLPILAYEIISGIKSRTYAKFLLETKASTLDQQVAFIHRDLITIQQKKSRDLDKNVFQEANRFLALTNERFREYRHFRHLTRVVFYFSYTRKMIRRALSIQLEKRHLMMRFLPTRLHFTFGTKPVLGMILSICLFDKYEFFEEEHILLSIQRFIPNAQVVSGSFHSHKSCEESILSIYIELEKRDGSKFHPSELALLKQSLPEEFKCRVEKMISSTFRIRNEEEVMKNIFLLSQELKIIHDLPQVIISFEEQSNAGLIFTVVLVRVLRPCDEPIEALFQSVGTGFQYILERNQVIGYIRKKFPKEANVFRIQIPKDPAFLRGNSSLNFYLARQKVVSILNQAIGEIRDYNGGMILKKGELFSQFKQSFNYISEKNEDLLENFFYSINPIERQATLPLSYLKNFFQLFLESARELPEKENYIIRVREELDSVFIMVSAKESSFKEDVAKVLAKFKGTREFLTTTEVYYRGVLFMGYIFNCQEAHKQKNFCLAVHEGMQQWLNRIKSMQILNLCCLNLPLSLDPRMAGDELSSTIIRMLFDGLMRIGKEGKLEYAIAESIKISEDLKKYTFTLRESYWSNGSKITAYDFEHSWKKILSPDFTTPFAYFLYPIKNAQAAKKGVVSIEEVGIKVLDDRTLLVELESPTPYFLELTAHSFLYPVNHVIDQIHPNWAIQEGDGFVCNGPFRVKKSTNLQGFELIKNSRHWDHSSVQLDKAIIVKATPSTAHEIFKKDEIDWLGMPLMHLWESFFSYNEDELVMMGPHRGIFWYVFNVQRFPFHHLKIRKALAYAIDRKAMLEILKYEAGKPALTPLPQIHSQIMGRDEIPDGDFSQARQLFEEGLQELRINRENFPVITLMHGTGELRKKTAYLIKQQWQKNLGIQCRLEGYDWSEIFKKAVDGDFEVSNMGWYPLINDPIYTLNAFKIPNTKINFSKWENSEYQQLLDAADQEIDPQQRYLYLAQAEKILLREMPFIPIFYEQQLYLKKARLKNIVHSEVGHIDFKWAYIEKT